jgi:CHAT domain-containing protein
MSEQIRILFLSANPRRTGRIQVDEEAREIAKKIREGSCRDDFDFEVRTAVRPADLQGLLLMYQPHIVHFSGHGNKAEKIILEGTLGQARTVDNQGLAQVFALYKQHVRLVVLNACFTHVLACAITQKIDYAVGTSKAIGDRGGVAFAAAFYRALGFGKSVKEAFASAKAELGLTKMPRTQGIELFVRDGLHKRDAFPCVRDRGLVFRTNARQTRLANHYL